MNKNYGRPLSEGEGTGRANSLHPLPSVPVVADRGTVIRTCRHLLMSAACRMWFGRRWSICVCGRCLVDAHGGER